MQLTSSFVASACHCAPPMRETIFTRVVTDSRLDCTGALFVALRGETFDGHDYISQAIQNGATGLLVSRAVNAPPITSVFNVTNTLAALQQLAAAHRDRFRGSVIAITGSNGKTTTKQMTASVLRAHFGEHAVLATEGNLNNHIGVPLTLLRLHEQHRAAVIEMGMNHFGEIALLTRLAKPNVAAITNAGPAHLEGVGSLMGVAKAKGEIFEALQTDGTAVINADDEYNAYWRVITRDFKQLQFGSSAQADVRGNVHEAAVFSVRGHGKGEAIELNLPMPGAHNRMNALAVAAIGQALGIALPTIKIGLETASNVAGRLTRHQLPNGMLVFDDSYNANPASMRAAADVLCSEPAPRYLVIGDMAELGENTAYLHRSLAEDLAKLPIDRVFTFGKRLGLVNDSFAGKASHFESHEAAAEALLPVCKAHAVMLVKGSNSMQMGRVIRLLDSMMKETL